ncbi:MAG: oligosaccharide flippase family protein [Deltaproteobacteria bacterium]|nr:oligosaccharide flippase family protein [Deltaproteobacteria bacterium]
MTGSAALDPRRTARATAFALTATAIEKGGAMLLLLVIARTLGAEGFGRYAGLMALLAFVQLGVEFGQEPVLVRLLAQRTAGDVARLVDGALAMRLVFATAGGVLLVVVGRRLLPIDLGALLFAAAGLVAASGAVLRAIFRTEQRLEWLCIVALANVTAFAAMLAVARALDLGLSGVVGAWCAGQLGTSLAAATIARRARRVRPRWRNAVTATLARSGWALALNAVLLTVTLRVGQLVVLSLAGAEQSGYLAAGSRLAEAFALLPEALMLVLLPTLSAYDVAARDAQRALSVRVIRWLGLLALTVIVAVSIAAPTLIAVLFGARYLPAAPALQISIWLALLAATGSVFTNLLIARGLERVLLVINAASSLVTVGLSLVVVPRLGFVGAAAVSLAAGVLAQVMLVLLPAIRAEVVACIRPLGRPIVAALVLALAGMRLPGPAPLVALVASALFVATSIAVGAIRADDLTLLKRALASSRAGNRD